MRCQGRTILDLILCLLVVVLLKHDPSTAMYHNLRKVSKIKAGAEKEWYQSRSHLPSVNPHKTDRWQALRRYADGVALADAIEDQHYNIGAFKTPNGTTVKVQVGGTAVLPCFVHKPHDVDVVWLRRTPFPPAALTVNRTKVTADDRFMVEHSMHSSLSWSLIIKHVLPQDEGWYSCQLATHPVVAIYVRLRVSVAYASIPGNDVLYVNNDSSMRLKCVIFDLTEAPTFLFWYHNDRMVNHEHGFKVNTMWSTSYLTIPYVNISHTGNYTCQPSNAIGASVMVFVTSSKPDENAAALLHGTSTRTSPALICSTFIVLAHLFMSNG